MVGERCRDWAPTFSFKFVALCLWSLIKLIITVVVVIIIIFLCVIIYINYHIYLLFTPLYPFTVDKQLATKSSIPDT